MEKSQNIETKSAFTPKIKEEGREITTNGRCELKLLVVVGFLNLCLSLFCSLICVFKEEGFQP